MLVKCLGDITLPEKPDIMLISFDAYNNASLGSLMWYSLLKISCGFFKFTVALDLRDDVDDILTAAPYLWCFAILCFANPS